MADLVTVVISALNDERSVADAVDSAFAAGAAEVIVSDGGSSDQTREIARAHRATVIQSLPWRSRQFNAGARIAKHDAILFLHADTTLPSGAGPAVIEALKRFDFGGFRIAFKERGWRLRIVAMLINLRTQITRCPWGDQAQFIRRGAGEFKEIAFMEDYELATRMKRRATLLPLRVTTSGRRFLEKGLVRTAITNWTIVLRWRRGADPDDLRRMYRS